MLDANQAADLIKSDHRNVHRSLRRLTETGLLIGDQHYKSRRYLYRAPEILDALDDYAADVARRQR